MATLNTKLLTKDQLNVWKGTGGGFHVKDGHLCTLSNSAYPDMQVAKILGYYQYNKFNDAEKVAKEKNALYYFPGDKLGITNSIMCGTITITESKYTPRSGYKIPYTYVSVTKEKSANGVYVVQPLPGFEKIPHFNVPKTESASAYLYNLYKNNKNISAGLQ